MTTARVHTLDVTSPLIQYAGLWNLQINENYDTYAYCDHNCSATLQFRGIQVLAATQCVGDECTIQFDDGTPPSHTGHPQNNTVDSRDDNNQVKIFNVEPGLYTFNIFTEKTLNLTHFNWTSIVNSLNDTRIQDDAPAFVYDPPDVWSTNITGFDLGNGHATSETNATGDRVALYGAVGVQGGGYTVQLDDKPFQSFTEQRNIPSPRSWLPDQLIFYVDGLDPGGNHTVTLVSQSTSPQVFILSFAIVDGNLNNNFTSTPPSSSAVPSQSSINTPSPSSKCEFFVLYLSTMSADRHASVVPDILDPNQTL
ncbi:hypothetical protein B0H13DRAFT_1918165 [Mycena leptocephala]|nr:hypothetical protein B0H13DRAFT_1918165 [Mycena leptocephala]